MQLNLKGVTFQELFSVDGLKKLDSRFLSLLSQQAPSLLDRLQAYRKGEDMAPFSVSQLIISLAPFLDSFLVDLYGIAAQATTLQNEVRSHDPVFIFKHYFVLKKARRMLRKVSELPDLNELSSIIESDLGIVIDKGSELALSRHAAALLNDEVANIEQIERISQWSARVLSGPLEETVAKDWSSFRLPKKLNFENLVDCYFCFDRISYS